MLEYVLGAIAVGLTVEAASTITDWRNERKQKKLSHLYKLFYKSHDEFWHYDWRGHYYSEDGSEVVINTFEDGLIVSLYLSSNEVSQWCLQNENNKWSMSKVNKSGAKINQEVATKLMYGSEQCIENLVTFYYSLHENKEYTTEDVLIEERADEKMDTSKREVIVVKKTSLFGDEKERMKELIQQREWLSDDELHKLETTYPHDLKELESCYEEMKSDEEATEVVNHTRTYIQQELNQIEKSIKQKKLLVLKNKAEVIKQR